MDAVAKRTIAVFALLICLCGALPLLTSVRGQGPESPIDWEVRELQKKVDALDNVPTEIALILKQQQVEAEWHKQDTDFQARLIWGFLGSAGAGFLALFGYMLHSFGITVGDPRRRKQ